MIRHIVPVIVVSLLCTSSAFAYVGPGVGLGVIGTLFGIFAAVALALFGLFWYPIKRAFSKKSSPTSEGHDQARVAAESDASDPGSDKVQ